MLIICRLFSCGTNKEGESHIVEWNESEGTVKRTFSGLGKRSVGVVQFDTSKNRFLVAGDEFLVKFWDMDNISMLTSTDADGGLPVITLEGYLHVQLAVLEQQFLYTNSFVGLFSRLLLAFGLTRKGYSWLSPQMTMGLKYLLMQMGFGLFD